MNICMFLNDAFDAVPTEVTLSEKPRENTSSYYSDCEDVGHLIILLFRMAKNNQTPPYINTSNMPGRWTRWKPERLHKALTELNRLGIVHDGFVCKRTPSNRKSVKFSADWNSIDTIGVGRRKKNDRTNKG